jgi:hypothetical protein
MIARNFLSCLALCRSRLENEKGLMGLYDKICASLKRGRTKPMDLETQRKALGAPTEGQLANYAERALLRSRAMRYRLRFLDANGRVAKDIKLDCPDAAALDNCVAGHADGRPMEVWHEQVVVKKYPATVRGTL